MQDRIANITQITHIKWGEMHVTVGTDLYAFKDCKVWPDGAKEWDWSEAGTHHHPGIQVGDIQEILEKDIDVIVLSRGMELKLETTPEVVAVLQEQRIEYHIEETNAAVALFNKLCSEGMRVGGIFHSTC